jgi:transcription antitermination factor NusG
MPETACEYPWFALKVRTRSEHVAVTALRSKGYAPFSPTHRERRRYSDRLKTVETPVFPGYVFCRFDPRNKVPVLNNPAVDYIVDFGSGPVSVRDEEIEAIRLALSMGAVPTEYLKVGQRVRVVYGALEGTEGILTRASNRNRLVLSVDMIQRSVALHIDADLVEPIQGQ